MGIDKNSAKQDKAQSDSIDKIISKLSDWRGSRLQLIRDLIKSTDKNIIEEVKWKKATNPDGVPVWSLNGIICTGEFYKSHLRLTFFKGSELDDPKGLLNSYRSMVIREDDTFNQADFRSLIRSAIALNRAKE